MYEVSYNSANNTMFMKEGTVTHVTEWSPTIEEESCNGIREISLKTKHF